MVYSCISEYMHLVCRSNFGMLNCTFEILKCIYILYHRHPRKTNLACIVNLEENDNMFCSVNIIAAAWLWACFRDNS